MSGSITHRERVLMALNHQQPDRVPIDFGGTKNSTIHRMAYERLKSHLGISAETRLMDRMMQVVEVDEAVLQRFDVDTRAVGPGPPDRPRGQEIDENTYQDEWGVQFHKPPNSYWYDPVRSPLSGEVTISDIVHFPFPDPYDRGRVREIVPRIEHLRRNTDCALVLYLPSAMIHKTQYLRGFEDWFVDVARDRRLLGALLDAVLEVSMALAGEILAVAGELVDVVYTADDLAGQNGPLISPQAYRELIKPRQLAYFAFIRSRTPAPIQYHSCGSIYSLLDDLIEIGVRAINPVQVSGRDMDTQRLKREFGKRVAFWGAVDTQRVLPYGTVKEVQAEVERVIRDLAPGGGYVLAAVHNIQPEIPPENIVAMFDTAQEFRLQPDGGQDPSTARTEECKSGLGL